MKYSDEVTERSLDVHIVGNIDIEKFRAVSNDICTSEVIITDKQIEHIRESHPQDYERFSSHIPQILNDPDYILEANKPNSAVLLREFAQENERFRLILRLKTTADPDEFKNSVISFWKISDSRYDNYIRNQKILYKRE